MFQLEVVVAERVNVSHVRVERHPRQRPWLARQLQLGLIEMIRVQVQVSERVNELARLQSANLCHHQQQQRVRRDVERHTEKQIRAALIQLATQHAVAHIELHQCMARRQRHLVEFAGVPRTDNVSPAIRVFFQPVDQSINLIHRASIRCPPVAPLRTVYPAKIAILARPLVPNRHPVVIEIFDIRVAL